MPSQEVESRFNVVYRLLIQNFKSIENATKILGEGEAISIINAENRLTYIRSLWTKCCELNAELYRVSTPDIHKTHGYFIKGDFETHELHFLDLTEQLQAIIAPKTANAAVNEETELAPEHLAHVAQVPRINLPRFSGSYIDWPSFHDYFNSLFVNDAPYDDLQRLHYLKACLDGEAASLLTHLPTTASNFKIAWDLLKARYANPRLLTSIQINKLFAVKAITHESSASLRALVDIFDQCIQSLRNLKRPVEHWDDHLVHLLCSKIDKITLRAWELSLTDRSTHPSFSSLCSFLERRIQGLESVQANRTQTSAHMHNSNVKTTLNPKVNTRAFHIKAKSDSSHMSTAKHCIICSSSHIIYSCPQLIQANPTRRLAIVKQSHYRCRYCDKRHHSLLHNAESDSSSLPRQFRSNPSQGKSPISSSFEAIPSVVSTHFSSNVTTKHILLVFSAWMLVSGNEYQQAKVRALLDPGSTHTLVSHRLVQALQCHTYPAPATLSGIGDTISGHVTQIAPLKLSSIFETGVNFDIDALVVHSLTTYLPHSHYPIPQLSYLKGLTLADNDLESQHPIQIIIGADLYPYILRDGIRRGSIDQPVAQSTAFGWVLSGHIGPNCISSTSRLRVHHAITLEPLEQLIQRFWEIENIPSTSALSEDDIKCEKYFEETVSRNSQGRYIVRIPFIEKVPNIGESKSRADKLLFSLETRLSRNKEHHALYNEFLRDYEDQGHMSEIGEPLTDDHSHVFLSHHPVFKQTSTTTKLRVVFNASSIMKNGRSLNDIQYVGPKLQGDLPLLITRWRTYRFVFCSDIEKMYRQILVHPAYHAFISMHSMAI